MTMSAIDDELKAIQVTKHKSCCMFGVKKHKPSLTELIKTGNNIKIEIINTIPCIFIQSI